jgi:hypothetical protein
LQAESGNNLKASGLAEGGALDKSEDALDARAGVVAGPHLTPSQPPFSPEALFGAARLMNPTTGNPFAIGPMPSDYVFPLPDTQEAATRMAWTASYRAWLDRIRLQTVEWLLPEGLRIGEEMLFDAVVVALELMLGSLSANVGLQGKLEARRLPGPGLAGVNHAPPL